MKDRRLDCVYQANMSDQAATSSLVQSSPELPPVVVVSPSVTAFAWHAESRWKRILFMLLALAITGLLWFFLYSFLAAAPGRPGVDENAYLVAGKNIAQHFTTGFKPTDDYQFVGAMWLRTGNGWYYPKYPFGVPLLNAIAVLAGHREWAFAISPGSACLAVLGTFFLARDIVGSFYAVLAMIALAMGPTTLQLADLPNSHAPALCVVVWGMFFLWRWWQQGRWQFGAAAGLLLGYAVTIRYTEALLLFPLYSLEVVRVDQFIGPRLIPVLKVIGLLPLGPLGIAVISRITWRSWRSYLRAGVPVFAWILPVGTLLLFNWFSTGHLTGYDSTNESRGFSIEYFLSKWDFSLYQLHLFGLFFILPLGIGGLIGVYRSSRRVGLLLTLWFVPGALLYTAYYWGENMPGVGYLRFFLTLFPPVIIAAMWLLRSAASGGRRSIASPLAAGIVTAVSVSVGLWSSIGELERQHRGTINLQYSARQIAANVKRSPGSRPMIIADEGMFPPLLQYMQFMLDADWYASDVFAARGGGGFGLAGVVQKISADSNSPVVLQRERIEYIDSVRKGKTDRDFIFDEQKLMDQALSAGRRVYVILPPSQLDEFRHRFIDGRYEMRQLDRWSEPCAIHFPDPNEHTFLSLPVWANNVISPWYPQTRTISEISRSSKR